VLLPRAANTFRITTTEAMGPRLRGDDVTVRTYLLSRLHRAAGRTIFPGMPYPYNILPQFDSGLVRLGVTPDDPAEGEPAIKAQRPPGTRRPHTDTTGESPSPDREHHADL
jgi:hypothetical protein